MTTYDICFINPPSPDLVNPHAQQPLGIMYLAAIAENAGHRTIVCNLAGGGMDAATWDIPLSQVYGISGTFLNIEAVNAVATELKRRNRRCRAIVGGPIAISRDQLDMSVIDTVVLGEGENVILDLIQRAGPPLVKGSPADVAALPTPARHLWPGPFGGNVFIGGHNHFGGGSATLLTSRGCPHKCAFCAGPYIDTPNVRFRKPADVVAEMEQIVTDFGVRQFRLCDEFFTCKRAHVAGVCNGICESKILKHGKGIAWRASIAVRPNDPGLFDMLHQAGCKEVSFGVESADPNVLDMLCRKGGPDDARLALKHARAAGLQTRALMMVGLPGETVETMKLNIAFLEARLADQVAVTVFVPVPGCDIANNPERYNCRIIPEHAARSLCMYGPKGRNEIWPTIDIDGLTQEAHAEHMAATVTVAEQLKSIGNGAA